MMVLVCTVTNKRDDTNYDAWWLVCTVAYMFCAFVCLRKVIDTSKAKSDWS